MYSSRSFLTAQTSCPTRDYTMLDAYNRLGPELTEAALRVQRAGLHCEETAHG